MSLKKETALQDCLREPTQANLESESSCSKLENLHSLNSVENVKKGTVSPGKKLWKLEPYGILIEQIYCWNKFLRFCQENSSG